MGAGKDSRRRGRARWGISGTDARLGGAAAVVASGLIHLHLGLVTAPDLGRVGLGRLFVAAGVAAVLVGIGVALHRHVALRLAAMTLLSASTLAFVLGRLGVDVLGSSSTGLAPSPQAPLALLCAIAGCALLAMTFLDWVGDGELLGRRAATAVAGMALAVPALAAVAWTRGDGEVVAVESGTVPLSTSTPTAAVGTDGPSIVPVTATTSTSGPTAIRPSSTTTAAPFTAAATAPATTRPATAPPTTTMPPSTAPPATTTTVAPTTAPAATIPPTTVPVTVRVRIGDFGFDPEVIEVRVGTTIEWFVDGSWDHSVEAADGSFASGLLASRGDTFGHRFDTAGLHPYADGFQPGHDGVIVVTP